MKLSFYKIALLVGSLLFGSYSKAQTQLGLDIDGENADDKSGYAVSMPDPNTVAIGAPKNDGGLITAGHVRVFHWDGMNWMQKGLDIDGESNNDESGRSVSMPDSNTIAIGAIDNDGAGFSSGHVRIYSWDGSAWIQKGADIDGEAPSDQSAWSIDMPDSNTVAIGAASNDGNGSNAGHVRVYAWDGSNWIQKGIDIDGEAANDNMGVAVSMPDSNTVAIGAYANDGNGLFAGHVRIYKWTGSNWLQKGSDIDGEAANDFSGWSVSMPDTNHFAVGAFGNGGNGIGAGHVRVFKWDGSDWSQMGSDLDGENAADNSGYSVSMPDSNIVAIGANENDGNGNESGHVRVYKWNGSNWSQLGQDIDGENPFDNSGWSISMIDTMTLAIGAPENDENGSNSGHVRVYRFCETSTTITPVECISYTSPSGNYTWTASGNYTDTLTNHLGCDSVIFINLTINPVFIGVSYNYPTITANATNATYQWLDCDNAYTELAGETNQLFNITANGNFAVEITQNGCIDTSTCVMINDVSVAEYVDQNIQLYPNPTNSSFVVQTSDGTPIQQLIIRNNVGQIIFENDNIHNIQEIFFEGKAGIYFVEVLVSDLERKNIRLIKE